MPKQCPRCKRTYPDSDRHCEDDGTQLVGQPVFARPTVQKFVWPLVVVIGLIAAGVAGIWGVRTYIRSNLEFKVEQLQLPVVGLREIATKTITAEVSCRITNRTFLALEVSSIEIELKVLDRRVAKFTPRTANLPLKLDPDVPARLIGDVEVKLSDMAKDGLHGLHNEFQINVRGNADVTLGPFRQNVPLAADVILRTQPKP